MADARRNVELKAVDPEPARSLDVCRGLGARDEGVLWQRDTYFMARQGGLKLREQRPGSPHLIQFERANEPRQRESRYRIVDVADPQTLTAALGFAIGVAVVVTKHRHLFLWRDVRIHLDVVEQLGSFIELEAVAPAGSDLAREHDLARELREAFSITDDRLVDRGYAELLTGRPPTELGS